MFYAVEINLLRQSSGHKILKTKSEAALSCFALLLFLG